MSSDNSEIKNINQLPNEEIKYIEKVDDFNDLDTEDLHLTDDNGKILTVIKGKDNIKGFLKDHFEFKNKIGLKDKLKMKIQMMEHIRNNKF